MSTNETKLMFMEGPSHLQYGIYNYKINFVGLVLLPHKLDDKTKAYNNSLDI